VIFSKGSGGGEGGEEEKTKNEFGIDESKIWNPVNLLELR